MEGYSGMEKKSVGKKKVVKAIHSQKRTPVLFVQKSSEKVYAALWPPKSSSDHLKAERESSKRSSEVIFLPTASKISDSENRFRIRFVTIECYLNFVLFMQTNNAISANEVLVCYSELNYFTPTLVINSSGLCGFVVLLLTLLSCVRCYSFAPQYH